MVRTEKREIARVQPADTLSDLLQRVNRVTEGQEGPTDILDIFAFRGPMYAALGEFPDAGFFVASTAIGRGLLHSSELPRVGKYARGKGLDPLDITAFTHLFHSFRESFVHPDRSFQQVMKYLNDEADLAGLAVEAKIAMGDDPAAERLLVKIPMRPMPIAPSSEAAGALALEPSNASRNGNQILDDLIDESLVERFTPNQSALEGSEEDGLIIHSDLRKRLTALFPEATYRELESFVISLTSLRRQFVPVDGPRGGSFTPDQIAAIGSLFGAYLKQPFGKRNFVRATREAMGSWQEESPVYNELRQSIEVPPSRIPKNKRLHAEIPLPGMQSVVPTTEDASATGKELTRSSTPHDEIASADVLIRDLHEVLADVERDISAEPVSPSVAEDVFTPEEEVVFDEVRDLSEATVKDESQLEKQSETDPVSAQFSRIEEPFLRGSALRVHAFLSDFPEGLVAVQDIFPSEEAREKFAQAVDPYLETKDFRQFLRGLLQSGVIRITSFEKKGKTMQGLAKDDMYAIVPLMNVMTRIFVEPLDLYASMSEYDQQALVKTARLIWRDLPGVGRIHDPKHLEQNDERPVGEPLAAETLHESVPIVPPGLRTSIRKHVARGPKFQLSPPRASTNFATEQPLYVSSDGSQATEQVHEKYTIPQKLQREIFRSDSMRALDPTLRLMVRSYVEKQTYSSQGELHIPEEFLEPLIGAIGKDDLESLRALMLQRTALHSVNFETDINFIAHQVVRALGWRIGGMSNSSFRKNVRGDNNSSALFGADLGVIIQHIQKWERADVTLSELYQKYILNGEKVPVEEKEVVA